MFIAKQRYRAFARRHTLPFNGLNHHALIKLWMLRILIKLDGQRLFLDKDTVMHDGIAKFLELECEDGLYNQREAQTDLYDLHQDIEQEASHNSCNNVLRKNLEALSQLIGLNSIEIAIMEFIACLKNYPILEASTEFLGTVSSTKLPEALAIILDLDLNAVRTSLKHNSTLIKSGLLSLSKYEDQSFSEKFELLSPDFTAQINTSLNNVVDLLRNSFRLSEPSLLHLNDFQHIDKDLAILIPYLQYATTHKKHGVNILIYGAPGTGKTQLTRVIADHLKLPLFQITSEDEDGDAIKGETRLRAYKAAQKLLEKQPTLLVFDEVEDIFNDADISRGMRSTAQSHKAWTNQTLETGYLPTFWLCNAIDSIDAAFIRRFDIVFELPAPPRAQRLQLIKNHAGIALSQETIDRLADHPEITPAIISRSGEIIQSVAANTTSAQQAEGFERLLNNTLIAQRHAPLRLATHESVAIPYHPSHINTKEDLIAIGEGLRHQQGAKICLYGPPGTGKTAYGKWLANKLDKPCLTLKGSDLLSKWVGGTEKNIAQAFRRAQDDQAILLIDEIDSFLQHREKNTHHWETTTVNEMLTQIDVFSGILIATTNFITQLDKAVLRRFDLKVLFDYLQPEQSRSLLLKYCHSLDLEPPSPDLQQRVMQLTTLTPGDFASLLRQHRFKPVISSTQLVEALIEECLLKSDNRSSIGFV